MYRLVGLSLVSVFFSVSGASAQGCGCCGISVPVVTASPCYSGCYRPYRRYYRRSAFLGPRFYAGYWGTYPRYYRRAAYFGRGYYAGYWRYPRYYRTAAYWRTGRYFGRRTFAGRTYGRTFRRAAFLRGRNVGFRRAGTFPQSRVRSWRIPRCTRSGSDRQRRIWPRRIRPRQARLADF